jgi:hypothetical protein
MNVEQNIVSIDVKLDLTAVFLQFTTQVCHVKVKETWPEDGTLRHSVRKLEGIGPRFTASHYSGAAIKVGGEPLMSTAEDASLYEAGGQSLMIHSVERSRHV